MFFIQQISSCFIDFIQDKEQFSKSKIKEIKYLSGEKREETEPMEI